MPKVFTAIPPQWLLGAMDNPSTVELEAVMFGIIFTITFFGPILLQCG
jgi:hypothetical protein